MDEMILVIKASESNLPGWTSFLAPVTLAVSSSHDTTASTAANGSPFSVCQNVALIVHETLHDSTS